MTSDSTPARETGHTAALLRHFADLRDRTHGHAPSLRAESREEKEELFRASVPLLDPYARMALHEIDADLLMSTGEIVAEGVRRDPDGGLEARWELTWPRQREAGAPPVLVRAFYGAGFHHPHLEGSTVGQWPLNVFSDAQAAEQMPVLRAIVAADLHNIVFQQDYRIVPATTEGRDG